MENQEKRTCNTCKYYVEHYAKMKTHFAPVCSGHCSNESVPIHKDKLFPFHEACACWEPILIQFWERKEAIEATIESMRTQLEQISFLLTDDKNKKELLTKQPK